jgi:minor extracellular serine protease Vpr
MRSVAQGLRVVLLALFVIAPVALAQPVEPWIEKLDPSARMLLATQVQGRGLRAEVAILDQLDVSVASDGALYASLFVRISAPDHGAALEAAGFRLQTLAGDVAVGTAPVSRLDSIAALDPVVAISVSRFVELLNDEGNRDINTPLVHAGTSLPRGYRGEGVIVGVLDTGIDVTHPDFMDENGTRIENLLEFLPDPDNDPPAAQREWNRTQINASIANFPQRDIHGHGTHVAGTAAGGGRAAEAFVGVAPESRLIVVKGTRTGGDPSQNLPNVFSQADIVNGTAWIFDRAVQLGMPAVVNLSLGAPGGPLDGSEDVVRALSNLAGEGRIIVFAGGNDGGVIIQAGAEYAAGAAPTVVVEPLASGMFQHGTFGQFIQVQGWYTSGTLSTISVAARDPATHAVIADISAPVGRSMEEFTALVAAGDTLGYVWIDAQTTRHPANQDGVFNAYVSQRQNVQEQNQVDLLRHLWSVTGTATATGRLDAWVVRRDMGRFLQRSDRIVDFVPGGTSMTLNRFAAGEHIISAAAYTTRTSWTNAAGESVSISGTLGHRTWFSSLGPTRDGRIRPDVAAPGSIIASARSAAADFGVNSQILGEPAYVMMQGTSMAAPFLSGAIALMLQVNPTLDPERVRDIIHRTARTDHMTGAVPNPSYGYGKLDVLAAVQATVEAVEEEAARAGLVLEHPYPNPTRGTIHFSYNVPRITQTNLRIYDVVGREVARIVEGEVLVGPRQASFDTRRLAAGTYLAVLSVGGERTARPFVVMR